MKNKIKIHNYNCGAVLIYQKNKINEVTSIKLSFDCGAKCDGDIPGLSHFCEHMFFTGTKDMSKKEISKKYFDFIKVNAYTSINGISFVGEIFTNELQDYLRTVIKMITESSFTKAEVEAEKKVVIQEIVRSADDYRSQHDFKTAYKLSNLDAYKNGILGNEKSVSKITSKDVKNYVKKYFVNNNAYIYITSPLSFDKIKKMIEKEFLSKLKTNPHVGHMPYYDETLTPSSGLEIQKRDINKNFLSMTVVIDKGYQDVNFMTNLYLLSSIMNDCSEGLMNTLRLEKSLVYSCSLYYMDFKKYTAFTFSTETSSKNIKECIKTFAEYIKSLKENGISEALFKKEKREIRYFKESSVASIKSVMSKLDNCRKYNTNKLPNFYKKRMATKKEDVENVLKYVFDNPKILTVITGNATKDDCYTQKEIQNLFKG